MVILQTNLFDQGELRLQPIDMFFLGHEDRVEEVPPFMQLPRRLYTNPSTFFTIAAVRRGGGNNTFSINYRLFNKL